MKNLFRRYFPPPRASAEDGSTAFWTIWAFVAAFGTYFCMYGYRKPFTAASFTDTLADATLWDHSFKTVLITSQVIGYAISKFIGIKVIAEMPPQKRAGAILALVALAEVALVLFGLVPRPWNAVFLFFNGLPLGMVFGLVLGFLEGRQLTEALTAGLCASFILADGFTKSAGAWLLDCGVSEDWMPAVAGLLFAVPLVIGVAMLARIPAPTRVDVSARAPRAPMTRAERWSLVARYLGGLAPLVLLYLAVTIVRSVRADFATEIWRDLGWKATPGTFAWSEIIVALGVLVANGSAVFVRDNRQAFLLSLATCAAGIALVGATLLGHQAGVVGGFAFMVGIGLGLYLPYVAMHTTVFERLLAMTRERGNLGFLMYVSDSIGYLGYVAVMVMHNVSRPEGDFIGFFRSICWIAVGAASLCLLLAVRYFVRYRPVAVAIPVSESA